MDHYEPQRIELKQRESLRVQINYTLYDAQTELFSQECE